MSSAAERFFSIPELTYMVAAHLNKHHTAMLVQTSRRLRQQCEPLLYNNLTLNYSPDLANLFEYPGATRALARSVCHVKQLELSVLDVVALLNCMLAYPDETEDSSDDTQGLRPEWLPSADPESKHVVPVPPMTSLERLKITYSYGPTCPYYLPRAQFKRVFQRHSGVLKKVVLQRCFMVASTTVRLFLTECPVLGHFKMQIREHGRIRGAYIELADVIEILWVCTKLQFLELSVVIPEMPNLEPGHVPYYERTPHVELTEAETELLGLLERFYQQIGTLTELRHLDLRAAAYYYDKEEPFPALLSLGDEESGRPGHLELLGGLTKLEELCGSVDTNNEETTVTMGWKEARWMASHWPALKLADFVDSEKELREPFEWFRKERNLEVERDPWRWITE
ncbi:hypothetical protein BGX23_006663 [Mortierella sp. AD031]|nr:hypothetical protein BGX23_006663 [Mortierella sp. AD031]